MMPPAHTARIATVFLLAATATASAATFTPTFNMPSFPGSQYTVTSVENDYYTTNYGITVSNAYLYKDTRDTFDGVGISAGPVSGINSPQTGRIDFLDSTNFVTIDYWTITPGSYSAFDSSGNQIGGTFSSASNQEGTHTFGGGIISYLLFSGTGGYTQISGLTYNYDGTTDGNNDDLNPVPLPASGLLLLGAFAASFGLRRRRKS